LEELIKHWKTVHEQTLAVEKAIADTEEAECHLTHPGAAASQKDKVAQLKQLDLSPQDIYLEVADYYHQHPVVQHIPKAKVSTRNLRHLRRRRQPRGPLWHEWRDLQVLFRPQSHE
jgi:hypothetical protein